MKKPGMTHGRWEVLAAMGWKPEGLRLYEVNAIVGGHLKSTASRLAHMKSAGLLVTVGNGTQTLWGMPGAEVRMRLRLRKLKEAAYARRLKLGAIRGARDRIISRRPRIVPVGKVRPAHIPAVNSVWAWSA